MSKMGKEVLIVDDDPDYCQLTRMRLQNAGYGVSTAKSGAEALTILQGGYKPDLIILDIEMPDKNGLTTLINLHVQEQFAPWGSGPKIPILVATGLQSEQIREIVMEQEVSDYLKKPYSADILLEKVERLTKHSG